MARAPWYIERALREFEERKSEETEFPPRGKKDVCSWVLRCKLCGKKATGKSMKELVHKAVVHTIKHHPQLFFIGTYLGESQSKIWRVNPYRYVDMYMSYVKGLISPGSVWGGEMAEIEAGLRGDLRGIPGIKNSVLVVLLDNVAYLVHNPKPDGSGYETVESYEGAHGYKKALLRALELAFVEGNYSFVWVVGVISPEKLPENIPRKTFMDRLLTERLKDMVREYPDMYALVLWDYIGKALEEFWDKHGKRVAEKLPSASIEMMYKVIGDRICVGRPDIWARAYMFKLEEWSEFPYHLWKLYLRYRRPIRRFTVPWIGTRKGPRHPQVLLSARPVPAAVELRTEEPMKWLELSDWILEGEMFRTLIDYPKVVVCKMPGCGSTIGCISYATAKKWMWKHFVERHLLQLLSKKLGIPAKTVETILDNAEYLLRVGGEYKRKYVNALTTLTSLAYRYHRALSEGILYEAEEILEQARPYAYMLFRKSPEEVLADPDKIDKARDAFENIGSTAMLRMALEYARAKTRGDEETVRKILDRIAPVAEVAFGEPPEDVIGKVVALVEALKASGKWSEAYLRRGDVEDVTKSVTLMLKWVNEEINKYASEFHHYFEIIIPDAYPDEFLVGFLPEAEGVNRRAMLIELISKSEQVASRKKQLERKLVELKESMAKVPEDSPEYRKIRDEYLRTHLEIRRCNSTLGNLMKRIRKATIEFENLYYQYLKVLRGRIEKELESITSEYEKMKELVEREGLESRYSKLVAKIRELEGEFMRVARLITTLENLRRKAKSKEELSRYEEELNELRQEATGIIAEMKKLAAEVERIAPILWDFYELKARKRAKEKDLGTIDWMLGKSETLLRLLRRERAEEH